MIRSIASLILVAMLAVACASSDQEPAVAAATELSDAVEEEVPFEVTDPAPASASAEPTPVSLRADGAKVRNDAGEVEPALVAAYFSGRQMQLTDDEVACVVAGIEDGTLLEVDLSRQVYFPEPSCISGATIAGAVNSAYPGATDLLTADEGQCLGDRFRDQLGFEAAMARCVTASTFGEFMMRIDDGDTTVPDEAAECVSEALRAGQTVVAAMEACIT